MSAARRIEKIYGLVWGQAIADALGEFYEGNSAERSSGADSIEFKTPGNQNDWTDDTDQLILLMENLATSNMQIDHKLFARQIRGWWQTNFREHYPGFERKRHIGMYTNFVISQRDFLDDPIGSCLRSCALMGDNHAANGAIMRNAICGVTNDWFDNSIAHCVVTHPDSRCVASCLVHSYIINCAYEGRVINWNHIYARCGRYILGKPFAHRNLREFKKFFEYGTTFDPAATPAAFAEFLRFLEIGDYQKNDGQCYTLLPMCLCIAVARDFALVEPADVGHYYDTRVREIIAAGGDTDTNACIVGAMIGAFVGFKKIAVTRIKRVYNADFLLERIKQFCSVRA